MTGPTTALSIRQPWAWAILQAGKDVENRVWRTAFRGPLLIHASKTVERDAFDVIERICGVRPPDNLPTGGIVGQAIITGCITQSTSPWFFGPFGFKLAHPVTLPFEPCRGQLGFFSLAGREEER